MFTLERAAHTDCGLNTYYGCPERLDSELESALHTLSESATNKKPTIAPQGRIAKYMVDGGKTKARPKMLPHVQHVPFQRGFRAKR